MPPLELTPPSVWEADHNEILNLAEEFIKTDSDFKTATLASKWGKGNNLLYQHFTNKNEIMSQLVVRFYNKLTEAISAGEDIDNYLARQTLSLKDAIELTIRVKWPYRTSFSPASFVNEISKARDEAFSAYIQYTKEPDELAEQNWYIRVGFAACEAMDVL